MSGRRRPVLAIGVVAGALALGGCGSSSSGGSAASTPATSTASAGTAAAGATRLALAADAGGALKFDKAALQAPGGTVTITLKNPAPLSHNIAIDGVATQGEVVGQGGTSTMTADLKPGTYTYFCAVPGHRQGGMEGKLTVN